MPKIDVYFEVDDAITTANSRLDVQARATCLPLPSSRIPALLDQGQACYHDGTLNHPHTMDIASKESPVTVAYITMVFFEQNNDSMLDLHHDPSNPTAILNLAPASAISSFPL